MIGVFGHISAFMKAHLALYPSQEYFRDTNHNIEDYNRSCQGILYKVIIGGQRYVNITRTPRTLAEHRSR